MGFIVFWTAGYDYSSWAYTRDDCAGMDPEILSSVEEVQEYVQAVLSQHRNARFKVFKVTGELCVETEVPDIIVSIKEIEQ